MDQHSGGIPSFGIAHLVVRTDIVEAARFEGERVRLRMENPVGLPLQPPVDSHRSDLV